MRIYSLRALAVLLALAAGLLPQPAGAAEIDPALRARLETAAPGERLDVYVLLDAQLDAASTLREVVDLPRRARRDLVISRLKSIARDTQAPLLAELDALRDAGEVGDVRSLWIANLLIAELTPSVVQRLAGDSAVRYLHLVRHYAPGEATDDLPVDGKMPAVPNAPEPNISLIGAPALWERGYRGQSMIVANIDTGTDDTHPDLANHIWQNIDETINGVDDDGNGFVDDVIGWDFESNDNNPRPSGSSHGTNTAGIVVGDGTNGRETGVAPAGLVMILKACGESPAMGAVQYAIDNGADAITSSCSYKFPGRPAYAVWRQISENELAVGIAHANSIGNQGQQLGTHPIPYNISAPGITPSSWHHPSQSILGGLGGLVATGGVLINLNAYGPSGKGPSAWEDIQATYPNQHEIPPIYWDYPWAGGTQQGLLKPDVVMPTNVVSTTLGGGYSNFGGTSAATPHTGGSLALLLSTTPNATPEQLSEALQSNVNDLGDPGKDNQFGAGLPHLPSAASSIWPAVTPVLEPFGQAVDPGGFVVLDFALINNTNVQQIVFARMDFTFPTGTMTVAGPGDMTIPANGKLERTWDYQLSPGMTDVLFDAVLVLEDLGGNEIASTDVEVYIR